MILLQTALIFAGLFIRVGGSTPGSYENRVTLTHEQAINYIHLSSNSQNEENISFTDLNLGELLDYVSIPTNLESYTFEICTHYVASSDGVNVSYDISLANFHFDAIDDGHDYSVDVSSITDNEWNTDGLNVIYSYNFDYGGFNISNTDYSLIYSSYHEIVNSVPVASNPDSCYMNFNLSIIPESVIRVILANATDTYSFKDGYNTGYDTGYIDGQKDGYNSGLKVGQNLGYSSGYYDGYRVGLSESGGPNFLDLFASIADTPVMMVRKLFSFDLFGVSALTVIMSLFSALALIWVIKKLIK